MMRLLVGQTAEASYAAPLVDRLPPHPTLPQTASTVGLYLSGQSARRFLLP